MIWLATGLATLVIMTSAGQILRQIQSSVVGGVGDSLHPMGPHAGWIFAVIALFVAVQLVRRARAARRSVVGEFWIFFMGAGYAMSIAALVLLGVILTSGLLKHDEAQLRWIRVVVYLLLDLPLLLLFRTGIGRAEHKAATAT